MMKGRSVLRRMVLVACLVGPPITQGLSYQLDSSWGPVAPKNISAAISGVASCAVSPGPSGNVFVGQRGKGAAPVLVFSKEGKFVRSFGSGLIKTVHGMQLQQTESGAFLWVTDSGASRVLKFDATSGQLVKTYGNATGTSLHPLQFGAVADVSFSGDEIYISDGDGGVNSRVLSLSPLTSGRHLVWATGAGKSTSYNVSFASPHSLAVMGDSGLVAVADRGNHRVLFLNRTDGSPFLPGWSLPFSTDSCPRPAVWTVRVAPNLNGGTLFVGTSTFGSGSDCPNATAHTGRLHVLPLPSSGSSPAPEVLAEVELPHGFPHEICVDTGNGDVYAAAVDTADLPPAAAGVQALTRYRRVPGNRALSPLPLGAQ